MTIKTILVEDHHLVRAAFRSMLQATAPEIEIIGEAENGEGGIRLIRELKPQVVVLDYKLPDITGLEVTHRALQIDPTIKILIVTSALNDLVPFRLLEAGAQGYLTKNASAEELTQAIKDVFVGKKVISPEVAKRLAFSKVTNVNANNPFASLSDREMEVMMMVIRCVPVKEIAKKLHLSAKTVHSYRSRIFEKVNVNNNVSLTLRALFYGLLVLEETENS